MLFGFQMSIDAKATDDQDVCEGLRRPPYGDAVRFLYILVGRSVNPVTVSISTGVRRAMTGAPSSHQKLTANCTLTAPSDCWVANLTTVEQACILIPVDG